MRLRSYLYSYILDTTTLTKRKRLALVLEGNLHSSSSVVVFFPVVVVVQNFGSDFPLVVQRFCILGFSLDPVSILKFSLRH